MSTKDEKEPPPEMVMDCFRLARSGNYMTAKALRAALVQFYPSATLDEIHATLRKVAHMAIKQYQER